MSLPETPKELSVRIHYDWCNQCRTCEFWASQDRLDVLAKVSCRNKKSELFGLVTTSSGHCPEWESYDYETALEVLDGKWDHIHNGRNAHPTGISQ